MAGSTVRFGLLGPVQVFEGDREVPIRGTLGRTILAALLLNAGSVVSLDHLANLLWGDEQPPATATASLYNRISGLRQALGEGGARIQAVSPGYLIQVEPGELDTQAFAADCAAGRGALAGARWQEAADHFLAALAHWRGRPLADVPALVGHPRIAELEENRWEALRGRIEADLHLGRHAVLIDELSALIIEQPRREAFHGQLMLALHRGARQAEALAVFDRLRTTLAEELGIEPSAALRELHDTLLNAEANHDVRDSVPRQLPADTPAFTGRADEVERLVQLAADAGSRGAPGAAVVCAIDGMGGVGKTTLAVHAAHRLAADFPDGQLFLDLHGHTHGRPPRSASEAAGWLLRAVGVAAAQIPKDGEQAAVLYRERLADSRTLIVLDNAATEEQVRPLLPGGGSCLVLVTSRRRLKALNKTHGVSLEVLSPPEAVALLRTTAGPGRLPVDDPRWSEIAELCGRLPLALRIAGALLRHQPAWPLEHLATLLRDQRQRVSALSDGDRDVAAVFDLSYANLDEPHRLLWRRLGLAPGPDLDAYAAAALMDCPAPAAAGLLRDLVDHNLLIEHRSERYRLHDLMRVHAQALAAVDPAPDRDAALDRLLHYYAYAAQSASIAISRHPRLTLEGPVPAEAPALPDADAARIWLHDENANLDAAFTYAQTNGLDEHTIAMAAGLAEILLTTGPFARALDIQHAAVDAAERAGRRAGHAIALTDLGRIRYLSGDYSGASDTASHALEIYRALGNRQGEASAHIDLGRVQHTTGEFAKACDSHARALEIYRALGNRLGEGSALSNLGWVHFMSGDYITSRDILVRAVKLHRALGNQFGEATALNYLGSVQPRIGDLSGATETLTRALELHHALGDRLGQAHALNSLGRVLHETGRDAEARDALTRTVEIYRAIGNRQGEANALQSLGPVLAATGDLTGASEILTGAVELFRSIGVRLGEAFSLVELGKVRNMAGEYSEALDALSPALEICREYDDRSNEAWALIYYAAALAATGRRPEAFALYQQSLATNREFNKPDEEALALEGLAEWHLADGDTESAADHFNQALAIFLRLGMATDTLRVQGRLDGLDGLAGHEAGL